MSDVVLVVLVCLTTAGAVWLAARWRVLRRTSFEEPACASCRHPIVTPSPRCPECGADLDEVRLVDARWPAKGHVTGAVLVIVGMHAVGGYAVGALFDRWGMPWSERTVVVLGAVADDGTAREQLRVTTVYRGTAVGTAGWPASLDSSTATMMTIGMPPGPGAPAEVRVERWADGAWSTATDGEGRTVAPSVRALADDVVRRGPIALIPVLRATRAEPVTTNEWPDVWRGWSRRTTSDWTIGSAAPGDAVVVRTEDLDRTRFSSRFEFPARIGFAAVLLAVFVRVARAAVRRRPRRVSQVFAHDEGAAAP